VTIHPNVDIETCMLCTLGRSENYYFSIYIDLLIYFEKSVKNSKIPT